MRNQTVWTGVLIAGCTLMLIAGCSTNAPPGDQGEIETITSQPSSVVDDTMRDDLDDVPNRAKGNDRERFSSRFPNIQLYTQDNQPVRFYDDLVKDKIVLVNFMYTSCTGT